MTQGQVRIEWAADAAALADAITDQRLFRIYATWLGMPDYPGLPALASIDRADLIRMWPNVVLVEVMADGRLRYRSAGPEVVKQLGRDIAGQFIDEIVTGSSFRTLVALYDLAVKTRATVYSRTRMALAGSDAEMIVHRLMLPVSNDRRRVDMVLAAQTFETAAGAADFTLGGFNRAEWNCQAWIDGGQAGATASAAPPASPAREPGRA